MPRRLAQGIRVTPVERELSDEALDFILEAALRRAGLVADLKSALLEGDQARIVAAARRVCGLEEEPRDINPTPDEEHSFEQLY